MKDEKNNERRINISAETIPQQNKNKKRRRRRKGWKTVLSQEKVGRQYYHSKIKHAFVSTET